MHGRAKGYIGEQLAAEYLEAKGLRIIARNKKFAGVEVDILAPSSHATATRWCFAKSRRRSRRTPIPPCG